ncbi:MAG: helix-turn-helix transcriptional regulator [Nitrospirota bacterium]|jgi:MerR family transcriptional regulator/heat shock protein HspR
MEKKKPLYMISVVAEILNIHPQTLRIYEREGFIKPKRTEGNTRLYSDEDIEKIKMVLRFTRDMGVNLAGVDMILRLRERMDEMRREMEEMMRHLSEEIREEFRRREEEIKKFPREGSKEKVITVKIKD